MKKLLILIIVIFGFNCCQNQTSNSKKYNRTYNIGQIPNIESFMKLQKLEIQMGQPFPNINNFTDENPFQKNRSRMFLDFVRNGEIKKKDSIYKKGIPSRCQCFIKNDTTFIKMGIGFFGGFGFSIKTYENKFESTFYEYTDDTKPYKTDLTNEIFSNHINVNNKYQSLILDTKPTKGKSLTGFLTFTTNNYYEKNTLNSLDTLFLTGKLYFTCEMTENMN